MKYIDIITGNKRLCTELSDMEVYSIGVLSNITVNQVKDILEYFLRINKINANVELGDYDNIVQDSQRFNQHKLVIIFWEVINLIDGLQYRNELMSETDIDNLIARIIGEIDFVLDNLKTVPAVVINQFSPLIFNSFNLQENNLDRICNELNLHLREKKNSNLKLVNIEKVIAKISVEKSSDLRYFYSSKALYTIDFFREYAEFILPIPLSLNGRTKKALIFDCDNTLWKGILGEDGFHDIIMSSKQKGGTPYEEVQSLALALKKKGVLLGLCSKNNAQDVDEVLVRNSNMTIHDEDMTVKMVNWDDKVSNLKEIGNKLNIGTESFIYVDDSDFEIEFVKKNFPMIKTVLVPQKIHEYPLEFRKALNFFYAPSFSVEDTKRVEMYREQIIRDDLKKKYETLDDYLSALEMTVKVYFNDNEVIPRMSQLTQKTNQFNLTTRRYSENEITFFVNEPGFDVVAISVSDKYGDNGITGLAIIKYDGTVAEIDTLLMSCRIIGRNIELIFSDIIFELCLKKKIQKVFGVYIQTVKNDQVSEFYDKLNFQVNEKSDHSTNYELVTERYIKSNIDYITIIYGR